MPFGWGGFDAFLLIVVLGLTVLCLQCLSAGGALMPDEKGFKRFMSWARLQCLSAGGALMPFRKFFKGKALFLVSNAFRLGGL